VDWADSFNHLGPPPEQVVSERNAKRMFENAGFEYMRPIPSGDHHYGLVFRKA
jgi:hypothetical protein